MADSWSVTFPPVAVDTIISGSFEMEPGVMPSAGSIVCTEQNISQQVGTLTLAWNSPETGTKTIALRDCKVEKISQVAVGRIEVLILDRRWRWRYGHIDGVYNVQTGDATWEYEKTPKQLMELLFAAMNELNVDLNQVTSTEKIAVNWKGDVPANALAELCSMLGYAVIPRPDDRFAVVKIGTGGTLPSNGSLGAQVLQAQTGAINDGHLPENIRVAAAPIRYQCKFELEAVGLESDGSVESLASVSYFSSLSAAQQVDNNFPDWEAISDDEDRKLAQLSLFRWYRITNIINGSGGANINPPGFLGEDDVSSVYQMLPLLPHLNETHVPAGSGYAVAQPFELEGEYYLQLDAETGFNTSANTKYEGGASIDVERGIVRFSRPVFMLVDNGRTADTLTVLDIEPADMRLTCCVEVRDGTNNQQQYYGWTWTAGGLPGSGILTIDRSELVPKVTADYTGDTLNSTSDNLTTIKAEATKFAEASYRQLVPQSRATQQFAGFHPVALDGVLQQTTWLWGGSGGPVTRVAAGGPYGSGGVDYRTRDRSAASRRRKRAAERREKRESERGTKERSQ